MNRQTLTRGALMIAGVLLVGLGFVGSYVGALHEPRFHGVALAVVGPTRLAERLDASGEFATTSVTTPQAAIRRIDQRKAFGAIIARPRSIDVLVAPAASHAISTALATNLPPALRAATGARERIRVIDVKPLPANDPNGITPFYIALGIVVANFIGAMFFALVFGFKPVARRRWWRVLGFGAMALALGLGEVGTVNVIGPLRGHYLALVLVALLLGTTVATITVAVQSSFGIIGGGVAILLFVVLGNPASGGPAATPLLPGFWRTMGPYLPTGAGTDLVRNIAYFDGNAITRPLLVLFAWLVGALIVVALSTPTRPVAVENRADRGRLKAVPKTAANA
jgi:hypothetical protein